MNLTPFQIFELVLGVFTFWIGIFQLSQNIKSNFSWLLFFFFLAIGFVVFTDPIISNTPDYRSYILWQKITDWPLFFMPTFCFHIAVYVNGLTRKLRSQLLSVYAFTIFLIIADVHGGLMLQEGVVRFDNFRRIDSFAPGILMIPFVAFCVICFIGGIYYYNKARKSFNNNKYLFPIIGMYVLIITGLLTGLAFYINIPAAQEIFNIGILGGIFFYVYFILSYYQLVNNERNIFDNSFVYRTFVLLLIIFWYIATFMIGRGHIDFSNMVYLIALILLIITSHSIYEWANTFINDLVYNPTSGFSVVNDQEVYQVLRNYHKPDRLESSPLLRLKILNSQTNQESKKLPVDTLRTVIKGSVDYFKPQEESHRRTKKNLKYHLLKMIAYDEAEEGQMLWELGFDEYPTKIMSGSTEKRQPLFARFYPSDYTYTSRNAFLALKKEAIHDITWRISYLEKLAKK